MTDDSLTISLSGELDPVEVARIHDSLRRFNEPHSGPYDRHDLLVTARTAEGALAGGLTGLTQWQWLYVDYLWVDERWRGSGLGARLMRAAEQEAAKRGCRWSRLYTYDFQAPGFYAKLGYEQWGVLEDFPPGHRQIWLRKAL
ncbi:GNAT family N-acetyltransferase [Azospirillum sp.]|uniref:GNAT family N-acetyltransferase n=1 Tax=Azospirillum sp. TaxID=34012 RepID=UPI003D7478FA